MKKASVILSSALVLGTLLAGCGNNNDANNAAPTNAPVETTAPATNSGSNTAGTETGKYKDGTYFGTIEADAETGWQTYALLTVEGGKITKADWNAFNVKNAGDLKKKFLKMVNMVWLKRAALNPNGMSKQLKPKLT